MITQSISMMKLWNSKRILCKKKFHVITNEWSWRLISSYVSRYMRTALISLEFGVVFCAINCFNWGKYVYSCSRFISNYVKVNLIKFLWLFFKFFVKFYQVFLKIFSKYWSCDFYFIILKFLLSNVLEFNFEIP